MTKKTKKTPSSPAPKAPEAYPVHPAAMLLPELTGDERAELKRSLQAGGQLVEIELYQGKVLDGRNRQALLLELGIAPKYVNANLKGRTPERFVVDMNLERRMLTASQKGWLAAQLVPDYAKEAKERQAAAGKTKKTPKGATSAAAKAAKVARTSTRTVERAIAIAKKAPELGPAIAAGDLTLREAEKKIRRVEQDQKVAAYVPAEGVFQMHTLDFSWPYRDTREGNDNQRGLPYPPQTLEEIVAYIRGPLAAGCDPQGCVVGNWITGPISIDSSIAPIVQREYEALGFKMIHERVWKKTRATGGAFIGQGTGIRWNAEKLQIYVRGEVAMAETGGDNPSPLQHTIFEAHVGEHSEKPQQAYDDLQALFPKLTKRLEHYARAPREGWVTTGAEMPDAAPAQGGSDTTSSAPAVEGGALVPPPAGESAPPAQGGALSDRSDNELQERGAKLFEQAARLPPVDARARLPELPPLPTDDVVTSVVELPNGEHVAEVVSDPADPFECVNCGATFISREILSKHAKACREIVSVVDAIAAGVQVIEVAADRQAVLREVGRLESLDAAPESAEGKRLRALQDALEAYRAARRSAAAPIAAPAPEPTVVPDEMPPVDPASLKPPDEDEINF